MYVGISCTILILITLDIYRQLSGKRRWKTTFDNTMKMWEDEDGTMLSTTNWRSVGLNDLIVKSIFKKLLMVPGDFGEAKKCFLGQMVLSLEILSFIHPVCRLSII